MGKVWTDSPHRKIQKGISPLKIGARNKNNNFYFGTKMIPKKASKNQRSFFCHFLICDPSDHLQESPGLSGPTTTVILSRCTVALHSVALRFSVFGGVSQENRATPPEATLSSVALQWAT